MSHQDGRTLARLRLSRSLATSSCGVWGARRGSWGEAAGGWREAGEVGRRFYCFLRPPPPAPRPRRHWKAARASRRRVIYREGCARVTEPGRADGAADALGRGAESTGLRAGRPRQWAPVCAAAAAAGGWGRGAGGRSPTPLPPACDPPKGDLPFLPQAGTGPRQLLLFIHLFFILSVSSLCPSLRLHLPRFAHSPLTR